MLLATFSSRIIERTNDKSEYKRPDRHLSRPDFDADDAKDEHGDCATFIENTDADDDEMHYGR